MTDHTVIDIPPAFAQNAGDANAQISSYLTHPVPMPRHRPALRKSHVSLPKPLMLVPSLPAVAQALASTASHPLRPQPISKLVAEQPVVEKPIAERPIAEKPIAEKAIAER